MAPIKRKAVTDERPSKKVKEGERSEKSDKKSAPKEGKDSDAGRKTVANSILQQEERAFPRGGASVLTPLEHKQIKLEAERDALFEQENGGKAAKTDEGEEDLFDQAAANQAKKQRKQKSKASKGTDKVEGSGVKIQGLSYKNLVVGSSVLGRVTAITGRDVALALPNNLTGYAPITAISARLNARIESMLAGDADNDEDDEDEDLNLKELFHIGQWLRASVIGTGSDSSDGKSKRHIELSIDPQQANGGLAAESVVVNSMLQASVRSVEDHGVVMDLGLADESVKGFISKKELGAFDPEKLQEGQVLMCMVTGKGSNGKVLKLSPDASRFSAKFGGKQAPTVSEAPTIDAFLPGTAVDILVTEAGPSGLVGKVMGMLDITADLLHSGREEDLSKKYKIGSKTKARLIWATPTDDGRRKIGASLLDHLLVLPPSSEMLVENASAQLRSLAKDLDNHLPLSSIIEDAKVTDVVPERGLYLTTPSSDRTKPGKNCFSHISQVSDDRIDSLSSTTGAFKLDSTHRIRIISYNPVDALYYVSMKNSTLEQSFLRLEDLTVGEDVKGTVDRLILGGSKGITGVLVKLSDSITGLVPEMHLSDVQLQHPERKFREGFPVKAKVLSVDFDKRQVRLTLKKSLVNADDATPMFKDYAILEPGMESKGTIASLHKSGAAVQFFGNVRAWLPVAEMSDTFIEKPEQHFRTGQTVNVRIVSVYSSAQEMKVSCKNAGDFGPEQEAAWESTTGGKLMSGTVTEKSEEAIMIDLEGGLKGLLRVGQLADGSTSKAEKALKQIRVGQTLSNLVVLDKLARSHHIALSNKSSLVQAAKKGDLMCTFNDAKKRKHVVGFVRNITPEGIYTEFANGVVGLVPKTQIASNMVGQPAFGLHKDQTVRAWVAGVDEARQRFTLSMREQTDEPSVNERSQSNKPTASLTNPVDPSIKTSADLTLGRVTKARIASIKGTQLNMRLADGVLGRIDASQVFDRWEDITNKRQPLQQFKPNEVLDVKVLGMYDSRNHRFLPISHRNNTNPVFELSAKKSDVTGPGKVLESMTDIAVGATYVAFVNNHSDGCVWVNLSPNVRGRVALMDLSDDAGALQNLNKSFPIGCALRVTVKAVDASANRLDLNARSGTTDGPLTIQNLTPNSVVPGRITKITERAVTVQLSDTLAGPVPLVELADDFSKVDTSSYEKNDIVRVCVLAVDRPNKKFFLSLRPSRVLSSSLPVADKSITKADQISAGDIVRGFVKHVADKGVFVSIGANVDAHVRVSDLSDQYVKDWKALFEVDQLVTGRVVTVQAESGHVQMSLKKSHVDKDYKPPIGISDLEVGMIITGKVRKVEDFGAFVDIDNTQPRVSGLCHRSEVAAKRIEDVRKLYSAGDVVKAKVLNIDVEKRKISLGLKASYFKDAAEEDEDEDEEDVDEEMESASDDEDMGVDVDGDEEGGVDLREVQSADSEDEVLNPDAMDVDEPSAATNGLGLKTSGFDWAGNNLDTADNAASDSEPDTAATKKRKRTKPEIKADLTGELDKYGPRSTSDFERQLLGQPNNSGLWIQYMAFQLQLSETQKARDIASRALRTIHIRETEEKGNIWIAWLNLEVEYGSSESVEDVFKNACQVQDPLEMHEKLASIYIDSGKHDAADNIFQAMLRNKTFRASPDIWLNFATFLLSTLNSPSRARALLPEALKSIPMTEHRPLTAKFAALEFHSPHGDPEHGRTIFENLVTEWPKWSSGWDQYVDLERSRLAAATTAEAKKEQQGRVRALFERMAKRKMKKRMARFLFKRWLEFEEAVGEQKGIERVKALAQEYVEREQAGKGADEEE
ncbi:hypothetical protein MBLNU230_g0075t1 [Neophaeotheca triangularis]